MHKDPLCASDAENSQAETSQSPVYSHNLSPRQIDVLTLIAEGLRNKDIAKRLGITPTTVKNHVVCILRTLGVSSRFQAAVKFHRQSLGGSTY
jgi:DNA-binding NarL/FixJ family response regulator